MRLVTAYGLEALIVASKGIVTTILLLSGANDIVASPGCPTPSSTTSLVTPDNPQKLLTNIVPLVVEGFHKMEPIKISLGFTEFSLN